MGEMAQALTISGTIFGIMMLTQYGRRVFNWHKAAMPLVSVSVIGWFYLRGIPTHTSELVVYLVGAAIGLGCGMLAAAVTGVERGANGKPYTRSGIAFTVVWLLVMALRIAFVYLAEHNTWFRGELGTFMMQHHITQDAIAPFFVIMALAMVLARLGVILARVRALPRTGGAERVAEPSAPAVAAR